MKKMIKILFFVFFLIILYYYSDSQKSYFNLDTGRTIKIKKIFCFAFISPSSSLALPYAYDQAGISHDSGRYITLSDYGFSQGFVCYPIETFSKLGEYVGNCLLDEKEISPKELIKIRDSATEKIHTGLFDYSFYYIPIVWKIENNFNHHEK